jgi:hypothetical protein
MAIPLTARMPDLQASLGSGTRQKMPAIVLGGLRDNGDLSPPRLGAPLLTQ